MKAQCDAVPFCSNLDQIIFSWTESAFHIIRVAARILGLALLVSGAIS